MYLWCSIQFTAGGSSSSTAVRADCVEQFDGLSTAVSSTVCATYTAYEYLSGVWSSYGRRRGDTDDDCMKKYPNKANRGWWKLIHLPWHNH